MKYLFATYWRGSMKVSTMRLFDSLEEVIKYVDNGEADIQHSVFYGFFRVYEFDGDKPPKLLSHKFYEEFVKKSPKYDVFQKEQFNRYKGVKHELA